MKRKPRRREATPVAHRILSKRMADHKPHDMICELVGNALNADARRVWIELGRRSVIVDDDGSEIFLRREGQTWLVVEGIRARAKDWLADAVVENFRSGFLDSQGLGADVIQARNPRCVVA